LRVLYLEDDAHEGELARRWLQRHARHFRVDIVATVADALPRLFANGQATCDVLLTDLRLPDGDGLSLLREIRARAMPVAVIVLTGPGGEQTAVAALQAGADDYLVKSSDYLERLPAALETAHQRFQAEASRRARPLRVLYVEHDLTDITLTTRHIDQYARNIKLDVTTSGIDALTRLSDGESERYDVCLFDYRMPGLDGLDLLRHLKRDRRCEVPIVLITGRGDEEVMLQALRLGAAGYVVKSPGYLYRLAAELESAHYRAQLERDQAALRESEARTRAILRAIPDLMFVQTDSGVYVDYYAQDHTDLIVPPDYFLGRTMHDVLPPALAQQIADCLRRARETGEPQIFEYSVPLNGTNRYFESRMVSAGPDRILSIVREITDRKLAEQALGQSSERIRLLAGRLIAAQEEERIRIANELHDDLSQRMAALTIGLSRLREQLAYLPGSHQEEIGALEQQATGLAERTRALSHELHSAVLEHVGLTAALQSFCSDFAALEVELQVEPLPARIASHVQLCLYRVVQETLHNVRRHSGAQRAVVRLAQREGSTVLTVSDAGAGFDPEHVRSKGGLGLISLEERVRLVGGKLQIVTGPGKGTVLRVSVPVGH
jgi:PAS domain S-box-containing protein